MSASAEELVSFYDGDRMRIDPTPPSEAGVAAVVVLLGVRTARDGFWAADGACVRFVPTLAMLAWIAGVGSFLFRRSPSTVTTPDRTPVPTA